MRGGAEITMVWTMVTVAKRRHAVTGSPAAVVGTVGFIVIDPDADAIDVSASSYATGRQERDQPDHEGDR